MNETKSKIPKGYKMTKLGVIPVEWVVGVFENITSITMGQSPSSLSYNENADGLPLIQGNTDIVNRESSPRVWTNEPTKTCEVGDLLLSVRAPVGTVAKSKHYASIGRGICSIKSTSSDQEFIYQFLLNFEKSWRRYEQGSTFTAVSSSDIKKLPIPLPPLPEQQKIASILSTWDKAIATQEALITQKEQLKKGLMQALLTGKKRFAGFEEEWEEEKLGNLFKIQGRVGWKGYRKEDLREYGPYVIGAKHIRNQLLDLSNPTYLSREKFEESPEIMIKPNDLLVVQRGSLGKIVLIEDEIGEATINPSMAILRPINADLNLKYIYYFLCSDFIQNLIISETGSTGVPMISQKQMGSFKIIYPTLEEQQKIANTLSSADKEIENLKTQLATLKLQKQGLMQELLTGKRRVELN
jgi:type I restriction enzyme S subunit